MMMHQGMLLAQVSWPAINSTTRPWTRWWWEGSAVDKANLTALMQQYKKAGLGGVEITPIYGVRGAEDKFIPFLTDTWMEMLMHTLNEGKRLGMGVDLANATGWPFGGPWVKPEDACRNFNVTYYQLKGGEQLKEKIEYQQQELIRTVGGGKVDIKNLSYPVATNKNLQAYAFDQLRYPMQIPLSVLMAYGSNGEAIDLTKKVDGNGRLQWTAPEGNWKLVALFAGWHGKMVERAAPGGEGDVIDHFSKQAIERYLQPFDVAFKGRDLSGLRSFFNDSYEVDDARGQSNWTPDFLEQFQKRRGYDLRKYLPLLVARDSSETGRRVLVDYRQTISDLVLDHFTAPWQAWAKAKGKMVRNQSHGSPANILDAYAIVDIPETEGEDILRFKFASSAGNVTGKKLIASETATWLNEHFQSSLGDVKLAVDKYFNGGVNHVVWHGTNYSPAGEAWPGWLFYAAVHFTPANPFWKDFETLNNYVARCQSFLQLGKPQNDVLLYFPFNDKLADRGRDMLHHFDGMKGLEHTPFNETASWLLDKGYAFDLISDKQIGTLLSKGNLLEAPGGQYRTVMLADVRTIPLETMKQLIKLANDGATILFKGGIPKQVPGLFEWESQQRELDRIYAALRFSSVGGVQRASVGKGAIVVSDEAGSLLQAAGVKRELMADQGLQFTRRSVGGGQVYFISNPGKTTLQQWMPLVLGKKNMQWFNPMTVQQGLARTRLNGDAIEVFLQLAPGESCILQTSDKALTGAEYPFYQTAAPAALNGKWDVAFTTGGPLMPAPLKQIELGPWTSHAGEAYQTFSGTAVYSTSFSKPVSGAKTFLLDLGKVEETATVWLNGKKLQTLIGPSFQLIIPASQLLAKNSLKIEVTNGMQNRIIDLEKKGVVWKKFYNINFSNRLPENKGPDGVFTAVHWKPAESGLVGPVTLAAAEPVKK